MCVCVPTLPDEIIDTFLIVYNIQTNIAQNPIQFWNYINSVRKGSGILSTMIYIDVMVTSGEDIADGFDQLFNNVHTTDSHSTILNLTLLLLHAS